MIGFLIEHYAGAFPAWLAPVQVRVLPVAEAHEEYADSVIAVLKEHGIRVEKSPSFDTLGKRIREGETSKIPFLFVVGDKEKEEQSVTVRQHGKRAGNSFSFRIRRNNPQFITSLLFNGETIGVEHFLFEKFIQKTLELVLHGSECIFERTTIFVNSFIPSSIMS